MGDQVPFWCAANIVRAKTALTWEQAKGSILQFHRIPAFIVQLLILAGLTACASTSSPPQQTATRPVVTALAPAKAQTATHPVLSIARDMVGTRYRYGGASPSGFDCSGLVYYSYRKAGIDVPRTTTEQYRQSQRVKLSQLQPGDLIFFKFSRDKLSHVGIYAGGGRFIHAPSGGKRVAYASLDNPYWEAKVIGAGRVR